MPLTLPAFAKINLSLRVLGKRPDAYHEIDTLLQTVSLHDTITFTPLAGPHIILSCTNRQLAGASNLIHQAAVRLQPYAPGKGVHIRLDKRVPINSGLGGGSSDAAVTLVALCYLWKINLTNRDMRAHAAALGTDVPFFFFGGAARATGTGTSIEELQDRGQKFAVIVKPNSNISTSEAYEALNSESLTTSNSKSILSSSQFGTSPGSLNPETLKNDFEAVVFKLQPEIQRAKAALMKAGATRALMTGSGSAIFGIFDNQQAQERAIQAIELETGWRVFPCLTVGRSHYRSAMGPLGAIFASFSGSDAGA